jgi:hypothetical protein
MSPPKTSAPKPRGGYLKKRDWGSQHELTFSLSLERAECELRAGVVENRSQFWNDLSMPFYGYNRLGAKISEQP